MKKVTLLALLALLIPWLTQSKIFVGKKSITTDLAVCKISPDEIVPGFASHGAHGFANSRVSGEAGGK